MGLLDRLLGRRSRPQDDGGHSTSVPRATSVPPMPSAPEPTSAPAGRSPDDQAVERYRYLLRTAPPEQIEQAHAEAFAKLTPEQRRQVLEGLSQHVPDVERSTDDDARSLARMATRAEVRQPGVLINVFEGGGYGGRGYGYGGGGGYGYGGGYGGGLGGMGMGGMGMGLGGGLLGSVAGAFIGTAVADSMFDAFDGRGDTYNTYNEYDSNNSFDQSGDQYGGDQYVDDGSGGFVGDPGGGFDGGDVSGGGDFGGGGDEV